MHERETITRWFDTRLPAEWGIASSDYVIDRDEILVIMTIQDADSRGPDFPGRFREASAPERRRIGIEAYERFGRRVSWGVRHGAQEELFTRLGVPIMTRLHIEERVILDELIEAGIARTRSQALAWCVRLVKSHEGPWLAELQQALDSLEHIRSRGPS